jgi:hypothetical protein
VAAGIFWRHKGPLTKFCQRAIFPRMIHNVASDEAAPFSRNLFSRWMIATIGDPVWASFLKEAGHPKRSVVFCTVVLMASADFWKSASQTKEIYSAMKSNNPIRSMHSDIVVIEASVFFLYNFVDFVLSAIKNGELVEADKDASISALVLMCHIIQATTGSAVSELLASRLSEYTERHSHEYAVGLFVGVLLRSVEKRTIHDPLLGLDPRPSLDFLKGIRDNAVWASTARGGSSTALIPARAHWPLSLLHRPGLLQQSHRRVVIGRSREGRGCWNLGCLRSMSIAMILPPLRLFVHPNKGGYVYVYNRDVSGEKLKIENVWHLGKTSNFVKDVDPKTGELIGRRELHEGMNKALCRAIDGAISWNSGSYNPDTGLYYKIGQEVLALALPEGRRVPSGPGSMFNRRPIAGLLSRGRERDLPGFQAIHPVPLPRSTTPAEPTIPCLLPVSSMLPPLGRQ